MDSFNAARNVFNAKTNVMYNEVGDIIETAGVSTAPLAMDMLETTLLSISTQIPEKGIGSGVDAIINNLLLKRGSPTPTTVGEGLLRYQEINKVVSNLRDPNTQRLGKILKDAYKQDLE